MRRLVLLLLLALPYSAYSQSQINLMEQSVEALKAMAYDRLAMQSRLQAEIQAINQAIEQKSAQQGQASPKPTPKEEAAKKAK